jgi:ribonuclease HI
MARQLNGVYTVKAAHLLPLYQRARALLAQFDTASVTHVRRELNRRADALSNIGADQVKQ